MSGTDFLSDPIKAAIAELEAKKKSKNAALDEQDASFDIIGFKDTLLDNKIRAVASRAKEYDQENPGAQTYTLIFPNNTSDIINAKPEEETVEVAKVVARIQSLGETHTLYPLAAALAECVEQVNVAIKTHLDSISLVGKAEAELQIAKANLIRQYLANKFAAELKFGKPVANRLFPIINSRNNGSDDEQESA
jgi:hypothetical protein